MSAADGMRAEGPRLAWPTAAFLAIAAIGCGFCLVGLGRASLWTDELFTLFLVDHDGGPAEVLRRSLTDTHPPLYYLVLYGWSRLTGMDAGALRLSSAVMALGALATFFFGTRREFSLTGRAFACALAVNSSFWFDQSQNLRNYALSLLISAALLVVALAARRRVAAGGPTLACWAGLSLLGLAGGLTHFYVFLEVGMIYLWIILTLPDWRLRAGLVASGLVIAGVELAYILTLLHGTEQNIHQMWFRNDALFFFNQVTVAWHNTAAYSGLAAATVLAVTAFRRARAGAASPPAPGATWALWLCGGTHVAMVVLGIGVSLALAPSISSINLATAQPLLWGLMAWLYDRGGPRPGAARYGVWSAVLVLVAVSHLPILVGRFLPRNEDWRGSARFVADEPACAGQPVPVVLAQYFGPSTPFFRELSRRWMYGRYFQDRGRLRVYTPGEMTGPSPDPAFVALAAARARDPAACRVLAWGVHDLTPENAEALAAAMGRLPGVAPTRVRAMSFDQVQHEEFGYSAEPMAFVFLAERPSR